MSNRPPAPPRDLGVPGRALWRAVVAGWELDPVELHQLREACRTADLLGTLQARVVTVDPADWRELRQLAAALAAQRIVLARLLAVLRPAPARGPTVAEEEAAARSSGRPRGVYRLDGARS